jgi:integrase
MRPSIALRPASLMATMLSRRNRTGQRRKETGRKARQLVDCRTGARALAGTRPGTAQKKKRDRALLAILLACGLRCHKLAILTFSHLQQREGHRAIVDLRGKAGHVRTMPARDRVYCEFSMWMEAAGIDGGRVFRRVNSAGKSWGDGVTEKLAWHVVKEFAAKIVSKLAHELRRYAESRTMPNRYEGCSFGVELMTNAINRIRHTPRKGQRPFRKAGRSSSGP